ncbi:elastin domain protein [Brucella abortus bv. 4 str. 292]|nr:elastin domain protein [Brucella abortus 2308]KFJ59594.1 elastin domain protein [Brucella abortus bv. 4 str. 292]
MALGGTDAAIRSDFDPEAIKLGAGAGLVMGGIGPAAGQAIGAGARKIGDVFASQSAAKAADMVPSALRYLNKAAIRDGLDAPAIQQRLADLGPEAMLMDISPNFKGAAGALANSPGEAQTIIRDALTKRMAGANQRA